MGYYQKIVQTPLQVRVYTYSGQVPDDYETDREQYEKRTDGDKSVASLNRAKDQLGLIIQCNIQRFSKFITLTTAENIKDRSEFLKKFKRLREQFKRQYGYALKYSAVMETQKRGAWHIHLVAYNLTEKIDIKKLDALWQRVAGKGHLDLKLVDDTKNLYKYLIKYLTKEEVGLNKKAVLNSRDLERPEIVKTVHVLNYQKYWGLDNPDYSKTWSVYQGDLKRDLLECQLENKSMAANMKKKMFDCIYQEWHK